MLKSISNENANFLFSDSASGVATSNSMRALRRTRWFTSLEQETAIAFDRGAFGFLCRERIRVVEEVDQILAQLTTISRHYP